MNGQNKLMRNLVVARETGLAMAVGSTYALRNPKMAESFSIARQTNPEGIILVMLVPMFL